MNDIKAWLLAGQLLLSLIVFVAGAISLRRKATAAEIREVRDEVRAMKDSQSKNCRDHMARTTTLEVKFQSVPTPAQLIAIHEKVNGVKSTVDKMDGTLTSVGKQMQLLYEHHLKEKAQ